MSNTIKWTHTVSFRTTWPRIGHHQRRALDQLHDLACESYPGVDGLSGHEDEEGVLVKLYGDDRSQLAHFALEHFQHILSAEDFAALQLLPEPA